MKGRLECVVCPLGVLFLCWMVFCIREIKGQAALYAPPGRSAMWAYLGNAEYASRLIANFDYTTNLNCGGKIVTPTTYQTSCGPCGDAVDPTNPAAVRSNEAPGGEYAIGEVVWYYHEGATINVTLDVRTPLAGGFYQFALCKTDASTIVTHDCFSHKLTWANTGQTTIPAPTYSGYATYTLQLPVGLTCDNCVLQWKWIDGAYTCQMLDMLVCGPTVTNCADIAIVPQGTQFPHHFDWPRYDEYASIFSADGNPGTLPHHTTSAVVLTTASLNDVTTAGTVPTIAPTTNQNTPTTTRSATIVTQTSPTTVQATPSVTETTSATTTRPPIIIVLTTSRPAEQVSSTREPEPTSGVTISTISTTTVSDTTPQAARLVQPQVAAAAAIVPSVLGVTSILSGQSGLGIIFLLLALFASQMKNHLQPFGGVSNSGFTLPRISPAYSSWNTYVPSLQWYGQSYTGLNNEYTRFGTIHQPFVRYPFGHYYVNNENVQNIPTGYPERFVGNDFRGISNVGNNRQFINGHPQGNSGFFNSGVHNGGNYPQSKIKYPNRNGGFFTNGVHNGGNYRQSTNRYTNRNSGYGTNGIKSSNRNSGYSKNINYNNQWNTNAKNNKMYNGNSYGNNANRNQRNTNQQYGFNKGYGKSTYGNSGQNNRNYNQNSHSLSRGMIAEYDNDPAPSVMKTPESGPCLCRGRLEVFTVYCMNYGDNRIGCEKEGDICFCKNEVR
ncbi:uncharacterized protein LOC132548698 [Ylistrum balloti]|uniref:uncharacterized protein LOC132548698 n=1 Tax=Ylistrum balloti TaxID=509963 RepID=UPI002905F625|nr:uncharacterized protein LOC132548698 [Ylistrum balloti]